MKSIFQIVAIIMGLSACHHAKDSTPQIQAIAVKTQKIELRAYAVPIICSGIMSSGKEARLSFKTGGIISRMFVKEGQMVHKGQLLALLNMTEVNAQVSQFQAANKKNNRDFLRAGNLLKDSAITQEQWENAATASQISDESLKIASFNKQHSAIYATIGGSVISKLSNEGEIAAPGAPIYIINSVNDDDWVIHVGVSDKDWARIRLNDKAEITLDAHPGQIFKGAVSTIAQSAEYSTGTFTIEIKINPGGQKFAKGLVANVQIFPSLREKVYLVPIEAVQEADSHTGKVFSVSPDKKTATLHKVQISYILKDMVAVRSGLENVEQVIVQGGAYLSDKFPINLKLD